MHVLIRAPNWVGDVVMSEPALRELRRIFAKDHLVLMARTWVAGLLDGEDLADELIAADDPSGPLGRVRSFASQAASLRKSRFDLAVLLPNSFGAALLVRAGGVRRVAGYATGGRGLLLNETIRFQPDYRQTHQVRYYLNIASELETILRGETQVMVEDVQPRLRPSRVQLARVRQMIDERVSAAAAAPSVRSRVVSRILVLNPGATNSQAKRWLAERFAATADLLTERDGFTTIIVGAPGDVEAAQQTAAQMRTDALMLAGETNIGELKAVLACASLVISNDTGAAHVSAALGVPTVVVFGPTEHLKTRPLSDRAAVVRHEVECSPCMLRTCPIDHRCMTRVEMDDVYRAAKGLLARCDRPAD